MGKVNYISLVKLSLVSIFMVALTACGGDSIGAEGEKEASVEEVGALVETPVTEEDLRITNKILSHTIDNNLKVATWVPEMESSTVKSKINAKSSYTPTVNILSQKIITTGDTTDGWMVYDNSPAGATIESIHDIVKGNVLKFTGDGLNNGYVVGYSFAKGSSWNDTANKTIKWTMNYSEDYIIYVRVMTKFGYRYLYYTNSNQNYGEINYDKPHYIHNGLGTASNDGMWRTFARDLSYDLKRHQPDNEIISVDGFFIRGSGLIDDVELFSTNSQHTNEVIYENAEDGKNSRWNIYTTGYEGTVSNIEDTEKSSRVIELDGDGINTGYILGGWNKENGWQHTINKKISWDMNYCENFVVYISVETEQGHRFITYSPLSDTTFASNPNYGEGKKVYGDYTYIHLGLNPNTKACSWKTVSRDLEADLKRYEPSNSITFVNAFLVRGSGKFDNIVMFDLNYIGYYDTSGSARDVVLSADGTKAFVADGREGLKIIDISNPSNPILLAKYYILSTSHNVALGDANGITLSADGSKVYVADGYDGLKIIDISNPMNPTLLGEYDTSAYAKSVTLSSDGTKAYIPLPNREAGFRIIDISDPMNPTLLGKYKSPSIYASARAIALSADGSKAYLADGLKGLKIIDVRNPMNPILLGMYDTEYMAEDVTLSSDGTKAYVAEGINGLKIIDISNPMNPTLLGKYDTLGYAISVTLSLDGNKVYVVDNHEGLHIIDISNPSSPALISKYEILANDMALSSDGTKGFLVDGNGLKIIDLR